MTTAPAGHLAIARDGEEHVVPIEAAVVRLGRGLTADVLLEDPTVSRRHALIVRRGDAVMLLDDRSMNGTWLNGERIQEAALGDGDVIQLGAVQLRYRAVPAPSPAA